MAPLRTSSHHSPISHLHFHLSSEELFYQLGLRQFGNFSRLKLQPPPPLRTLIEIAVELEEATEESGLTKPQIVDVGVTHLTI